MTTDPLMEMYDEDHEPIHLWFNLTYANYLTLHRSLLQSMPEEWQHRFVRCLVELADAFEHVEQAPVLTVSARDRDGKFIKDPIPHYNRGRTRVEPRTRVRG